MANASETLAKPIDAEHRVVIRRVGWDGYQSLQRMVGDQPIRLTYDRGDVELISAWMREVVLPRIKGRTGT
jgi:hypothetical protein